MTISSVPRCYGIDACAAGWIVVDSPACVDTPDVRFRLVAAGGLAWVCHDARLALIDIPIGLPSGRTEPRRADSGARRLLPGHGSRVFPVPVRNAVYAGSYEQANAENRAACGKGVTRQAWNICPKIRRVDELLRRDSECRWRMRESSPEICFAVLAGGPLPSKKRKDGISARIDTLERAAPNARRLVDAARADLPRPSVAMDDILDALVLCVSAARIVVDGASGGIPEEADFDDVGLPMQMLYPPAEPPEAP